MPPFLHPAPPSPRFDLKRPDEIDSPESHDPALREPSAVRRLLDKSSTGGVADGFFRGLVLCAALSILAVVTLVVTELLTESRLSIQEFGWKFFTRSDWDPVQGLFGALPFIYGTVVSSLLALMMAVPLGIGVAMFMTEMCPRALRGAVAFFVELLAAIPSVVYGLWGIFVLAPLMRGYIQPWLKNTLGWTGFFEGPPYGIGMVTAGVILAIMIVPFVSSITREMMLAVPQTQREAVLALGSTRWEMIRVGILRNARAGILGGIILALGRALGETMAVTMLIGNRPEISKSLLAPGYTMASVIANEFTEATEDLYLSALVEIGLALFLVTIIVNALAQLMIWSITRGHKGTAHA
jgi:phosphate transport system permease protein